MAYNPNTDSDTEQNLGPEDLKDLMSRWNASQQQRLSDINTGAKQLADPSNPNYFEATPEQTRVAQAANATAMGTLGPVGAEENAAGKLARQAELEATFAKHNPPNLENLIKGPAKSAEEAAQTFEGFQMVGEPYGGSLAKLKPKPPMTQAQPPALRSRTPEVLPAEEAIAQESNTGLVPLKDIETSAAAPKGGLGDEFSQEAANKLALKLGISGTAAAALIAKYAPEKQNSKIPPSSPLAQSKQEESNPFAPNAIDKIEPDQEEEFSKVTSREAPKASNQPKKDEIQDLIKSAQADSLASDANLKDAQHRADTVAMVNQLGKAANVIGAGVAKATPANQELFDQNIKQSEKIVSDLQERIKNQANDPGSEVSRSARAMLSKVTGKSIPETMSASTLDKIQPGLMQLVAKEETNKRLAEQARQHNEEMRFRYSQLAAQKDIAKQEKKEATNTKRFDTMNKMLSDEIASSRSSFGKAANIIRSGEAIEQLVGSGDPNNLDSRQITELARNLDAMLSSGQATISGMKKLLPETAMGSAAKIQEYIMNQPKGAQQGEFVKRMVETVQREKELAKDQLIRSKGKMLGSYTDLKEADPEKWDNMMRLHNIPTDIFDKDAIKERETKSPSQYTPAQEAGISAFMSAHPELSREKAIKVLKDNKRL